MSMNEMSPCPAHYTDCVPPTGAPWPQHSPFVLEVIETRFYPEAPPSIPHKVLFAIKVSDYVQRIGSYSPQMLSIFIPLLTSGKVQLDFPSMGEGAYERLELPIGTPLMTKLEAVAVVSQCLRCIAESPKDAFVCRRPTISSSMTQAIQIQIKKKPPQSPPPQKR